MSILFIGGGNMAAALIGGLIARGERADGIEFVDPDEGTRARLSARFGVRGHASLASLPDAASDDGVVVLAVKPQQMRAVAQALARRVGGRLVVSIAAGIRAADLARWLDGHARIVRAMPNTPALIGKGITGLASLPGLSAADMERAEAVMAACGETVRLDDESGLDAVTAVSGSGPAYVFLLMEAMQAAALEMGLDEGQARALTLATFTGAAELAARSEDPPAVLRERVTSKGGTTAAALAHMQAMDLPRHFRDAIGAARRRAVELGDELGQD